MASKAMEVRAGIVVLLGLGILGLGLFLVSGGTDQLRDKGYYTILFEDAGGIGGGDAVYLAGQRIGSVERVEARKVGDTSKVAVTIKVYATAEIHQNATFRISQTITGITTMRILYGSGALADAETLLSGTKLATFEEAIDGATLLINDARAMVGDLQRAAKGIDSMVADLQERKLPEKVEAIVKEVAGAIEDARRIVRNAEAPVDEVLARLRSAARALDETIVQIKADYGEKMEPRVTAALESLRKAAADVEGLLSTNRPRIDALVQNLKDASERVSPVLQRIEGLARGADETVIEVRPRLVATLENAKRAMKNFEAVTQDLKTAPWKLVNKPTDEEAREVHLYNAASLYTAAVGDVAAGIEELGTLKDLGLLASPEGAARVVEALARLNRAIEEHDRLQQALVDLIVAGAKAKN
ncbi:MAG: MlaD family protein [Planctomycetaceae bacterium]